MMSRGWEAQRSSGEGASQARELPLELQPALRKARGRLGEAVAEIALGAVPIEVVRSYPSAEACLRHEFLYAQVHSAGDIEAYVRRSFRLDGALALAQVHPERLVGAWLNFVGCMTGAVLELPGDHVVPLLERVRRVAAVEVGSMHGLLQRHAERIQAAHQDGMGASQQNRRLRDIVEFARDGIVVTDARGNVAQFNRAAQQMFGLGADEVEGRKFSRLVFDSLAGSSEGTAGMVLDLFSAESAGDEARELQGIRRNGEVFPVEAFAASFEDGHTSYGVWTLRDVSEQRAATAALERSERGFRALIEGSPDAICVYRDQGFVYVNPTALQLLGYADPATLLGKAPTMVVHPEEREVFRSEVLRSVQTGESRSLGLRRFLRRDGSLLRAVTVVMPLVFDGEPSVMVVARDVTEQHDMQLKLLQSDRMASIGTIAAGAAHEINNPLMWLLGSLELIRTELPRIGDGLLDLRSALLREPDGAVAARLTDAADLMNALTQIRALVDAAREASEGAQQVKNIVGDLKAFSRVEPEERQPVDVNETLRRALNMGWSQIKYRARLSKEFGELPPVMGSEGRLAQVFLNLVLNAAQSIPEHQVDENRIRVETGRKGFDVFVRVQDTGTGIAPEALPHLFEPFFTTKPVGVGSGLGLPICLQIVESMDGRIEVHSEVGKGTTFTVWLPLAIQPEFGHDMVSDGGSTSMNHPTIRGRVLVIDDEAYVVSSLQRLLRRDHEVEICRSGEEALELLAADDGFDVIICDLMMRGVSGMDVYRTVQSARPQLARRMVFMTGGAFTAESKDFLEAVPNMMLEKPPDIPALRRLVRSMVEL